VFGYGPQLWGESFREAIGMRNATHGHNQFMDTLSRAGTVGASALGVYAAVLLVLALRWARATRGLSLALFMALALRAMSEVPLLLLGYGPELITHMLLLMTLAAAPALARTTPAAASQRSSQAPPWMRSGAWRHP
jgi:O-antigen ligase